VKRAELLEARVYPELMETPPLRHHDTVRMVRGHHTGQWLLNGCSYTFDLPCRSGFRHNIQPFQKGANGT
jgi:hypothetical protein